MIKQQGKQRKSREAFLARPSRTPEDVPFGWPGEEQSRDRKKRALWSSMLMSSVIARLF